MKISQLTLIGFYGVSLLTHGIEFLPTKPIDLGTLTRSAPTALRFTISSNDAEALTIAREALYLHGGLVEDPKNPQYVLTLNCGNSVTVSILASGQTVPLLSDSVLGDQKEKSILKACDRVLENLFGTRGYLAGKIAFVTEINGHKEICISDLLFRNVIQVTNYRSQSVLPRWHPNGQKFVFTSYCKFGSPDLFIMDTSNHRMSPLATYKGTNSGACFSPDGGKIIMGLSAFKGPQLYLATLSGKIEKPLTDSAGSKVDPAWSPDGRWLIFGWDKGGTKPQLYKMSLPTTASPQRIPIHLSGYVAEPCWHPDGTQILFTAATGKQFQLGSFNFKTGESKVLTSGPQSHLEGRWLSDGRHIICTERTNLEKHLVIFDTVTQKLIPLPCQRLKNTCQADFIYLP